MFNTITHSIPENGRMFHILQKQWIIWVADGLKFQQELGECIPLPIQNFLASPNRKSMGQSGSLVIFLYPDYEVNEAENRKGS